jgi:RHS repeat-associated protein
MKTICLILSALLLAALHATAAPGIDWNNGVSYTYDPAGNIRAMGTDTHVNDVAGRLVQSDTNGIRQNYEYDGFGNRTKCLSPGTDCQYGYGIDSQTNRLSGVPYDAGGHLKSFEGHTYDYDDLDMQTRDHTTMADREYIYTADDERIAVYSVGAGRWAWTLRDASGKVLREMTSQNGSGGTLGTASWSWVKDHVWRDGQLLASRQIELGSSTPSTYHYHLDHLGTPRRITNDGDQIAGVHNYHAFGRETAGGTNERSLTVLKFTGHERDIAGSEGCDTLDYMHARYYSACVGRFVSVDPVLDVKKAVGDPQRWNRYAYVRNQPMTSTDPTGAVIYDQLTDNRKEDLRKQLENKTGIGLKYGNGQLQATGQILTDANGKQIGSATARADLQRALAPGATFIMKQTTNSAHGMAAQAGAMTYVNFNKMQQVIGGNANGGTFNFAMIVMHEMLGHGVNNLHDNFSTTNPTGDTVDYENKIRRELGITNERLEYETHKDGTRYYIKFTNGRIWVPQP